MNLVSRYLFLLVFTLMQCIAPVAHAHVDGHNSGQGIHIDFDADELTVHGDQDICTVSIPHHASPTIGIPLGHTTDKNVHIVETQPGRGLPLIRNAALEPPFSPSADFAQTTQSYERPFGQAPPL